MVPPSAQLQRDGLSGAARLNGTLQYLVVLFSACLGLLAESSMTESNEAAKFAAQQRIWGLLELVQAVTIQ